MNDINPRFLLVLLLTIMSLTSLYATAFSSATSAVNIEASGQIINSEEQLAPIGIFWWPERVPYNPDEMTQCNVVLLDGHVPNGGSLRSQTELTAKVQELRGYGKAVWGVVGGDPGTWVTQAQRLATAGCLVIDCDDFWTVWHSQGYDVVTLFGDIYDAVNTIDPKIKICITEASVPSYIEGFLSALESAGEPLPDYICPSRSSQNTDEDPLTWADWQVNEYRRIQSKFGIDKVFGNILFADLNWNTGASMDFYRKAVNHTWTKLDGLLTWGVGWAAWDTNWEQVKSILAETTG